MIDVSYEIKKFKEIDTTSLPSDEIYGENIRLAFALYNKAIKNIEDGYDDLGRLDLRKALQLYPSFNLATILLAMSTFSSGDRIGAVRLFNTVKEPTMRKKGLLYLDYLANEADKLDRNTDRKKIKEDEIFFFEFEKPIDQREFINFEVIEVDNTINEIPLEEKEIEEEILEEIGKEEEDDKIDDFFLESEEKEERPRLNKSYFVYAFLGLFILVLLFLFVSKNKENIVLTDEIKSLQAHVNRPTDKPNKSDKADNVEETPEPTDYKAETKRKVDACIEHFNFRQYFEVVKMYHTIKEEYVEPEDKANLDKIYRLSLSNFTSQNYNTHFALSNAGKYQEVVEVLLPILEYNPNYLANDAVTFYIGKAYEDGKNIEKAIEYYTMTVDNYPNTNYSNWAAYRLKVIG